MQLLFSSSSGVPPPLSFCFPIAQPLACFRKESSKQHPSNSVRNRWRPCLVSCLELESASLPARSKADTADNTPAAPLAHNPTAACSPPEASSTLSPRDGAGVDESFLVHARTEETQERTRHSVHSDCRVGSMFKCTELKKIVDASSESPQRRVKLRAGEFTAPCETPGLLAGTLGNSLLQCFPRPYLSIEQRQRVCEYHPYKKNPIFYMIRRGGLACRLSDILFILQ
jgi:hypothetical protein